MHDKTTHTSEQPNKEDIQYQVLTMTWDNWNSHQGYK